MKSQLTIVFTLITIFSFGQADTTYLDSDWDNVSTLDSAEYYQIVQHNREDTSRTVKLVYNMSGQILKESNYRGDSLDGKLKRWYIDGQLKRDIDYKDGEWNGKRLTYWDNGNPKRIDSLVKGEVISSKCFNYNGKEMSYQYDYLIMPEFRGGEDKMSKFIQRHVKYPAKSYEKGISGKVEVQFTVNQDGSISDIKILRGVNKEYENEAIRLVKAMPKWYPGYEDGDPVRIVFILPINFVI